MSIESIGPEPIIKPISTQNNSELPCPSQDKDGSFRDYRAAMILLNLEITRKSSRVPAHIRQAVRDRVQGMFSERNEILTNETEV